MKKRLPCQTAMLLCVILLFAGFNASIYVLLTRRLSNNFSDTSQAKMVDVAAFLPFEDDSDLAHIDTDFSMDGDLPVLDGAAALVPVYASIIDSVYPAGCVTYEGGVFSDENYYGENFAPDSKMQYKNTVRGYKAIVDGETDILFCAAPSAEQKAYAEEQGITCYISLEEKMACGIGACLACVCKSKEVDHHTGVHNKRICKDGPVFLAQEVEL